LVINIKERLSVLDGSWNIMFVFQEVALKFGHVDLELRKLVSELLLLFL
jgi:hypothetical protein